MPGALRSLASAVQPLGGTDDSQEDRTGGRSARRAAGLGERRLGSADYARHERRGRTGAVQHEAQRASSALPRTRSRSSRARRRRSAAPARRSSPRIISLWASAYAKTGTNVAYQAIGSGGGVAQIQAQTVDFGASDTPMTRHRAGGRQGRPDPAHPDGPRRRDVAYHVKGVESGLKFDGDDDRARSSRQTSRLERPGDQEAQPRRRTCRRADRRRPPLGLSGTTGVFTDFLTKTSPTWVSKLGGADKSLGKTIAWPTGIGGKGNDGVSAIVNQTEGAIGYVELQYAIAQQAHATASSRTSRRHLHPAVRRDDDRGAPSRRPSRRTYRPA